MKNNISRLNDIHITETDLTKYIQRIKPNKSPGPDGIHPRILKELATAIAKPLCMLFQTSLNEGSLPGDWRIGNISPIHKKGPKTDAGNYRPVCLTSIICKIMESFIRDKVLRHMRENDLLSEHQHGFLPGRSTITQLLEAMDYWTEALDNGNDIVNMVPHTWKQVQFIDALHQNKNPVKFLLNEQYVFVGGNISFLCVLSCSSEEA